MGSTELSNQLEPLVSHSTAASDPAPPGTIWQAMSRVHQSAHWLPTAYSACCRDITRGRVDQSKSTIFTWQSHYLNGRYQRQINQGITDVHFFHWTVSNAQPRLYCVSGYTERSIYYADWPQAIPLKSSHNDPICGCRHHAKSANHFTLRSYHRQWQPNNLLIHFQECVALVSIENVYSVS